MEIVLFVTGLIESVGSGFIIWGLYVNPSRSKTFNILRMVMMIGIAIGGGFLIKGSVEHWILMFLASLACGGFGLLVWALGLREN